MTRERKSYSKGGSRRKPWRRMESPLSTNVYKITTKLGLVLGLDPVIFGGIKSWIHPGIIKKSNDAC